MPAEADLSAAASASTTDQPQESKHRTFQFRPDWQEHVGDCIAYVNEAQALVDYIVDQKAHNRELKEAEEFLELLNFSDVPTSKEWQELQQSIVESKKAAAADFNEIV